MSLIDLASEEAERLGVKVVAIHLKLGPLCGVVKEALQSAYGLAREGSPLAEATLVIEPTTIVAWCPACGREQRIESARQLCCPVCGAPTPEVRGGRELEMTGIEVLNVDQHADCGSSPKVA